MHHIPYHNFDIATYAAEIIEFSFAVYGFNSGHFSSRKGRPVFKVALAADTRPCGRAMFKQFVNCPVIADSAINLLTLITVSKVASVLHGCCIHTHRFEKRKTEQKFWAVQAAIV